MGCGKPLIPYVSLYFKELMYICDGNSLYIDIEPDKKVLFVNAKSLPSNSSSETLGHDGEESSMRILYCRSSSTLSSSGRCTPPREYFGGRAVKARARQRRSEGHNPELASGSSGEEDEVDESDEEKCEESDAGVRIQWVTMSEDLEGKHSQDDVTVSVLETVLQYCCSRIYNECLVVLQESSRN